MCICLKVNYESLSSCKKASSLTCNPNGYIRLNKDAVRVRGRSRAAVDALLLLPLPNELRVSYGERVRGGGHAPFLIVPSLSTP